MSVIRRKRSEGDVEWLRQTEGLINAKLRLVGVREKELTVIKSDTNRLFVFTVIAVLVIVTIGIFK